MCGVAGYWGARPVDSAVVEKMVDRLRHRGPDDVGVWFDENTNLALGHRRLSIIDLSPAGHQPMGSPCGRYWISYNGEIYNHLELRQALEAEGGHFNWRGHSDTETLLAALRHWGLEDALAKLNGMFAFALWDAQKQTLYMARDRLGEKPLYYGRSGSTFLFGSELKALAAHPEWEGQVNREALALFLRHNYVPAPWSIYSDIYKLPPAHFVTVRDGGQAVSEPICYWDLCDVAESGTFQAGCVPEDMVNECDMLLRDAVRRRMTADVPLGAFLSGGVDSSTIAAIMQVQSDRPVRTFSIGMRHEYDEAKHARAVADHLGTEHTEMYVTPEQTLEVIPQLPHVFDEPFADQSQIPSLIVSRLAKQHVTVALSGDGGDELFGGYNRHIVGPDIWKKASLLPYKLRRVLAASVRQLGRSDLDGMARRLPKRWRIPNLSNKLEKLAGALNARDGLAFYRDLCSHCKDPSSVILSAEEPNTRLKGHECLPDLPDLRDLMMCLDMLTYLPDDILTKVDRTSMAVSLEARVPFLDHRLVEFAWRVPNELKIRNGKGKWLLRQVLYQYVPRSLLERPKQGFGVPIGSWLRGSLSGWAEQLLDERRLCQEGYFDPDVVRRMWRQHKSGKERWQYELWGILMFQAWLERK